MTITRKALQRRTFLRGMGTAIALPFLDAMTPAFASGQLRQSSAIRMAFVYVPNGMIMDGWNPELRRQAGRTAAHLEGLSSRTKRTSCCSAT